MTDPGPAREFVVAYDTGGKEPVRKLVTSKKTMLLQRAKQAFCVVGEGVYELDYYHAKLGVHIRPDKPQDIPDDCVQVRLVPPVLECTFESSLSTASTVPILTIQGTSVAVSDDVEAFLNPSVGPSTPTFHSPSSRSDVRRGADAPTVAPAGEGAAEEEPGAGAQDQSNDDPPGLSQEEDPSCDPKKEKQRTPFRVHVGDLDGHLATCVREGTALSKADRVRLMDIIYQQFCKQYRSRYLGDRLESVATDIVQQFPTLYMGMDLYDRMNLTKAMLANKFKNARRGDTSDEVVSKKRSKKSILNYLPKDEEERDAGELRHKLREGQLEGTMLKEAMDKTFADRRQLVVKRKIGLAALKRVYPALFNEVEIWEELARIRGANRTWEDELNEARMSLRSMLDGVAFCDTQDEKLAHILIEMREEHAVFGPPGGQAGPPSIHEQALWVEGCQVARFEKFTTKVDQFLTWGAAFTTFAQRLGFRATQAAAYMANVHILKTDSCTAPKNFKKIMPYFK